MTDSRSTEALAPPARRRRGGLIVIGDEVLARRVEDRNIALVLDAFVAHGIRAGEVAIVPDDVPRVAAVVRDFASRFDVVITTGGVGPTHDDCTWRAVAVACDDALVVHPGVLERLRRHSRTPLTAEQERMALLPSRVEIFRSDTGGFALHVGDVWVLPGVPSMVAAKLDAICRRYASAPAVVRELYFAVQEWEVVAAIDAVVAAHPRAEIGSYPVFDADADHGLRVSVVADEPAVVEAVAADLKARISGYLRG